MALRCGGRAQGGRTVGKVVATRSTRDEEDRRGCGVQGREESSVRGVFKGSFKCLQADMGENLE